MSKYPTQKLAVIIEREAVESRWETHRWQLVGAVPDVGGEPRTIVDFFMFQLSKVDWRKGVLALGGLGVVVIVLSISLIWRHHRAADPFAGLKPGVYQPAQNSGDTLPVPAPRK